MTELRTCSTCLILFLVEYNTKETETVCKRCKKIREKLTAN